MGKSTNYTNGKITVYGSDDMWASLNKYNDKYELKQKLIQKYGMRVSNTSLTYRQINYLDKSGLLGAGRNDDDKKWRLFKFRDAVYLNTIFELKKFGIRNENLKGIHALFYDDENIMDDVIVACMFGLEMIMIIDEYGGGYILSPNFLDLYEDDDDAIFRDGTQIAELRIRLNHAVNKTLADGGLKWANITVTHTSFNKTDKWSEAESKIIDAIRNKDFEEIRLKKKNGVPNVIYASSTPKSNISKQELLLAVTHPGEFSDIQIKHRDGKVVSYQHASTIKL